MSISTLPRHYADAELSSPVELTARERLQVLADTLAGYGDTHDQDPDTSWLQPDPLD